MTRESPGKLVRRGSYRWQGQSDLRVRRLPEADRLRGSPGSGGESDAAVPLATPAGARVLGDPARSGPLDVSQHSIGAPRTPQDPYRSLQPSVELYSALRCTEH